MKLPNELKKAISELPSEEKDKLIFRLLRKDEVLTNRLLFELVSDKTVEEARNEVKKDIIRMIEHSTKYFYSPGCLREDVGSMSGAITEHTAITKDKYGEISLNLFMITEVLQRNRENIMKSTPQKAKKFCTAVIARAFKILILIKKLHEDYRIEFAEDLEKFGTLISDIPYLADAATVNGFNTKWLLNIPDDIELIHKDIREQGLLC